MQLETTTRESYKNYDKTYYLRNTNTSITDVKDKLSIEEIHKAATEFSTTFSPLSKHNAAHTASRKMRAEYLKTSYARSFCNDKQDNLQIN